jgi:hypothetical protein
MLDIMSGYKYTLDKSEGDLHHGDLAPFITLKLFLVTVLF